MMCKTHILFAADKPLHLSPTTIFAFNPMAGQYTNARPSGAT
jgi:hypothetical protein